MNAVVGENEGIFLGGGVELLLDQLVAVGATLIYSFVVTYVIMFVLNMVMPGGIRVTEEDEQTGLDLTQHAESGYALELV